MPSTLVIAALAVTALITSFISGILGMAGGMIFMGALLALVTVPQAMMLHGVTQLASNGWRAVLWRTSIDWRIFRGNAYGALTALAAFAAVQVVVSKPVALLILGATPFIGLALPRELVLDVKRRGHPFACGAICTALQLLAGVAGPILDVFFVRSQMDRRAVVATKASVQVLGHIIKITYFGTLVAAASRGSIDWRLAVLMIAIAIAGTTLSRKVLESLTDASFRQWTRRTVLTLGVVYLGMGLWLIAKA